MSVFAGISDNPLCVNSQKSNYWSEVADIYMKPLKCIAQCCERLTCQHRRVLWCFKHLVSEVLSACNLTLDMPMFSSGNPWPLTSRLSCCVWVFLIVSRSSRKMCGEEEERAWDKWGVQDVLCLRKVEIASGTVLKEMNLFPEKLKFWEGSLRLRYLSPKLETGCCLWRIF